MMNVHKTLVSLIKRTFGNMEREKAVAMFNEILDNQDNQEAFDATLAAIHEVFDRSEKGKVINMKELEPKVAELVGDKVESKDALKDCIRDVLATPAFHGIQGRKGGTYRVADKK